MQTIEDYYEILQVHFFAEPEIIEAAYKRLARKYHPDVNGDLFAPEKMKRINTAYDVLRDPARRCEYNDEWLRARGGPAAPAGTATRARRVLLMEVSPDRIAFKDVGSGEVKTAHFDVLSVPGSHVERGAGSLPAWLKITDIQTLCDDPVLVRVHVCVTGPAKGESFDCFVPVKVVDDEDASHVEEVRVRVKLEMKGPVLQINRKLVEFEVITDVLPSPQTVVLKNAGMGHIEGSIVPRQKWIKVSPRAVAFSDRRELQIQIDTAKMVVDVMGYIDVRLNGGSEVIAVRARLVPRGKKR